MFDKIGEIDGKSLEGGKMISFSLPFAHQNSNPMGE